MESLQSQVEVLTQEIKARRNSAIVDETQRLRIKSLQDETLSLRSRLLSFEGGERLASATQTLQSSKLSSVVKLQGIVRRFIAKGKVHRRRVHVLAQMQGVLVAAGRTEQGSTGWYVGPDDHLYYFSTADGDWRLVCGPVTHQEFSQPFEDQRLHGKEIGALLPVIY